MKKILILSLVSILLLPLLVLGCNKEESPPLPTPSTVPAINGGQEAKMIELTLDDFRAQNNIVKDIELIRPGSLIVTLGSNPSTGYKWDDAEISAPAVLVQASHNFVGPSEPRATGAPGKEVWVFNSLTNGTTTIKIGYSRPWEGGEKNTFTLTINVTVK